mgnify:CR=1 FL=1
MRKRDNLGARARLERNICRVGFIVALDFMLYRRFNFAISSQKLHLLRWKVTTDTAVDDVRLLGWQYG